MPRTRITHTDQNLDYQEFGLLDAKGRGLGVRIKTFITIATEAPADAAWSSLASSLAPGSYFGCHVQVTRAGEAFGATSDRRYFESEAERTAYIAKRVAAARANAEKLARGAK